MESPDITKNINMAIYNNDAHDSTYQNYLNSVNNNRPASAAS